MAFRVLLTDRAWPDYSVERAILVAAGAEILEASAADEESLCTLAADVDAIGVCWAPITARVLAAAPRCRIVARFGAGLDNIDLAAARARGIMVTYVPDYCVIEVSDHVLALLLALARQVGFFHQRTKQGEYRLTAAPPMHRIAGQVLGLFGLGRIGQAVAQKATALGLTVIAHTPAGDAHGTPCQMVCFEELLARSDFLSIHAPLNAQTRGRFGLAEFSRMKPTAFLINTARGPLVKPEELEAALQQRRLAGAALDVFDPEPPRLTDPLYGDERVIVTPHAAFLSVEALLELRTRGARQIVAALRGERPEQIVVG